MTHYWKIKKSYNGSGNIKLILCFEKSECENFSENSASNTQNGVSSINDQGMSHTYESTDQGMTSICLNHVKGNLNTVVWYTKGKAAKRPFYRAATRPYIWFIYLSFVWAWNRIYFKMRWMSSNQWQLRNQLCAVNQNVIEVAAVEETLHLRKWFQFVSYS